MPKLNEKEKMKISEKHDHELDFENLFKGEKGHANIFVFYKYTYNELIKLVSDSEIYWWDEELLLWTEKTKGEIVFQISNFLDIHISNIIEDIAKDKKKADKYYELVKIHKMVRNVKHCENVYKFVAPQIVDKTFKQKLNKVPNQLPFCRRLPIVQHLIIDLKTLKVRERVKSDYFDFELPYDFIPKQVSEAEKFFEQIMNNDNEVVRYLQTILGYCITGETDLRSLFIFWGSGSNGKSTLCELLKKILDKFYISADKKIFIKQERGSSHTSHLIPLVNARLAVLSETEEGEKLNESLIKALTGNDTISARELYGKQFSFKPVAKYVMLTNHKPTFNINDQALLDRIRYIPFTARFTSKPKNGEFLKDCRFIEKLMTEYLDEVFTWLCIGANNYYNLDGNIDTPKSLQDATNDYINEIDNVSQFLTDVCEKNVESTTNRSELFERYKGYCCDNGFTYQRNSDFYKRLEKLGFKLSIVKGVRKIKGLKIINYLD